MRRDLVTLFALALGVRIAAALLLDYAPYTDPAYYRLVADQLAAGRGFTVPVLWSFLEVGGRLPLQPSLPVPSNGHWMPLTSILAAGSIWLLGGMLGEGRAAQVPSILLGTAEISGVGFERADGSPIRIDTDYLGRSRNPTNPFPGPFEDPDGGPQVVPVWASRLPEPGIRAGV